MKVGTPDPRPFGDEPPPIDPTGNDNPYDYASPLANRMPAKSSITSFTLIGFPAVWITERESVLSNAVAQYAPFDTVAIIPGMNRPLTEEEAAILNARYPV